MCCQIGIFCALYTNIALSADPLPCLNGCLCFYSTYDNTNTANCSNNNMTNLPDQVPPGTQQLIMAGKYLTTIDSTDKSLLQIKNITFKGGNIRHISDGAWKSLLQNLGTLDLSWNKLRYISDILQTGTYKRHIWLSNNPFLCNCDMMWMRDWLLNATNVMDKENITCASGEWKGKTAVQGLNFKHLYCI